MLFFKKLSNANHERKSWRHGTSASRKGKVIEEDDMGAEKERSNVEEERHDKRGSLRVVG